MSCVVGQAIVYDGAVMPSDEMVAGARMVLPSAPMLPMMVLGVPQPGHAKSLVETAFVQIAHVPWDCGHCGMALAKACTAWGSVHGVWQAGQVRASLSPVGPPRRSMANVLSAP